MEPTETRQLAAIMFADMVGYTALMQADEETAKALRDRHRKVLVQSVARHQGKILQFYGDGTLSIFNSAVEAVKCAVEIQAELRQDPAIPLRIGVHTGDVVQDENGVYGHGVNVAARIEALAASGGVLVSGKVFDEIKNHPTLPAVHLGPVQLKNVDHPTMVFAIAAEGLAVPTEEDFKAKVSGAPGASPPVRKPRDEGWLDPGGSSDHERGPGEILLASIRKRAMLPWALLYLIGAWIVVAAGGFLTSLLAWPPLVHQGIQVLAFTGFFITLVVSWFHGEKGRQATTATEVGLVTLIVVAGGIALALVHDRDEGPAAPGMTPPLVATPAIAGRPAVAVLPFDNFSPEADDAYFANGVQEDITTALSRIRALRVPARSSADRYRESRPSTQEMAAALGADFLLEGSATVVGGTARVTVQLIDGRTDQHLWAGEYDHEFSVEQLIAVRSAVAREVADRLRAIITPEEEARIATPPTENAVAWQLYQRARFRWNERTEAGVQASLRLFQQALDLDPDFAEAHAGMADAYLVLSNWGWMDHRDGHQRGIAAAEQALALDPENAGAMASLGALHLWSTRDWSRSEAYFRRSIELDGEYAYAHYWYSALLSALGRHEDAIDEALDAEALDPLSPQIAYGTSRALFLAREYAEAVEATEEALVGYPDYGPLLAQLCRCQIFLGNMDEAEAACLREKEVSGTGRTLSMALLRAYQGDRAGAREEMEGVRTLQGDDELQPIFAAMIYAELGDTDAAFERLGRAFDGDFPYLEYLPSNPFFDPLREDPRYDALLRRIGLEE